VEAIYQQKSSKQQRSSKRLPFYNELLILIDSEQIITTANTFNISQDGIGITSYLDIPVGTKILAHLVFDSVDCEVEGKIEWSSKNSSDISFKMGDISFKMGVQLLKVTNEFNEIYQRINRKFNNPKTDTQTIILQIHKAEQIIFP